MASLPTQEDLAREMAVEGVRDRRLLEAFRQVPRALFVPSQLIEHAYVDEPLPIEHRQVTTQPSLLAKMIESLSLVGDEKVLEIGTGYGFQTALMSRLASYVWSVERFPDVARRARGNLARDGVRNVTVVVGDGSAGLPEQAPFDAILVSAAYPSVPAPIAEQLGPGVREALRGARLPLLIAASNAFRSRAACPRDRGRARRVSRPRR